MTPTSPIIEALAWSFIGGLLGSIFCIVCYDFVDKIVRWFK